MRKSIFRLMFVMTLLLSNQNVSSQATCTGNWEKCLIEASPTPNYICHQYIRAALENNWVDLNTGIPSVSSTSFASLATGEIFYDNKYVFYPNIPTYDVVVYHNSQGLGHSVLKLRNSTLFASKWQYDPLYWLTRPDYYLETYLTNPQYMVYVGDPTPSSSCIAPDQMIMFSIKNVSGLKYSWNFNSNYFTLLSANKSTNTISLKTKSSSVSSTNVTLDVWYFNDKKRSFSIPVTISYQNCSIDPCQGKFMINGSSTIYSINTVNSVSASPITANMNGGTGVVYTWTLTSGSPSSWYYYGTGNKTLYVALNVNSSASFRLTSGTCNRSITFYRGSTLKASKLLNSLSDSINAQFDTLFIPYDAVNEFDNTAALDANVKDGVYVNQLRKTLIINDNIEGERAYKIISMQGILKKNGKINGGKTEIDIQDLPSGIYIITLADCSYRFIKQ